MFSNLSFLFSLLSIFVIIIYAILVFCNVEPIVATAIGVMIGFIVNLSSTIEMGHSLEDELNSFWFSCNGNPNYVVNPLQFICCVITNLLPDNCRLC